MDTRFWGPSGWKLLHTAAFLYPIHPTPSQKADMFEFLQTLPYVLPCKFCRHSLTCYYEADPPGPHALRSRGTLTRWLWRIHNQVNNKLRAQNLNPSSNPSFESVEKFYEVWLADADNFSCYLPAFWDFLFAVGYNHPKEAQRQSTPMPNCPEAALRCADVAERNKWNTLSYKVRMSWYSRFWKSLANILGESLGSEWREQQLVARPNWKNRRTTMAWLWRMRCGLEPNFKDPYTEVCSKISNFSSDCAKSKRARTCRRRALGKRRTQKAK